tara:strand:- start:69 stop:737 length:669 start_codon:yes stop_codon:yes gene_type:complete
MSLTIDQAAFTRTLRRYAKVNKKTFREIVNKKALDLAFNAQRLTEAADPQAIEYKLGAIGNKVGRNRKTGGTRKGRRILKEDNFAARIVNSRRKKAGQPLIWGKELERAAQKLINARVRAVRFLRSGWLPAIKKLSFAVDRRDRVRWPKGLTKGKAKPKGYGIAARSELKPAALVVNSATKNNAKAQSKIIKGLKAGLNATMADMVVYIERKMGRDWRKAGF